MDSSLWVLQWILAVAFTGAGLLKAFAPPEQLLANPQMGWVTDVGIRRTRMAGFAELVGAAGLVVPGLTALPGYFTPLAAVGLAIVTALAVFTVHLPRGDTFVPPLVLMLLCLTVAFGRLAVPV